MPRPVSVTLVFNPGAGEGTTDESTLSGWLRDAGCAPRLVVKGEEDVEAALAEPGELVVVAGGDGTVRKAALALAGRDVPIAVVPAGTANNVARHLGWDGSQAQLVAALRGGPRRRLDLGRARSGDETQTFLESVGAGLFARRLARVDPQEKDSKKQVESVRDQLHHDVEELLATLDELRPDELELRLDGIDLSGSYLFVEALNLSAVGPRLPLAPDADPADGALELVLVAADARDQLADFLRGCRDGSAPRSPFPARRGRRLELAWEDFPLHHDGKPWRRAGDAEDAPGLLLVDVEREAVTFLVPASSSPPSR